MTNTNQPKRGGRRDGAGRPARFGTRMKAYTVRMTPELHDRLVAEHGSFQAAIEHLLKVAAESQAS